MVEFTPDAIAHRSFRTALRGFDQSAVREFLRELADALAAVVAERDELASKVQVGDAEEMRHEIEVVSKEIHSVLEAARSAAETMRERAAGEAARWRSEAIAEAERARREAQVDAEHLRTDAWTTSENLLVGVQREVDRIRAETEKEAMRLVGEAEREAHRTVGAGRRESEEAVRIARMEAEKLVLAAKASHDEIIETATRKAEVAQERTRALEERRDELRGELDGVRAAIAAVESELDERREALGLTPPVQASPEPPAAGEWSPGETVRVIRPGHQEFQTDDLPVISEARPVPDPTPELRVLSPQELRSRQQESGPPDDEGAGDDVLAADEDVLAADAPHDAADDAIEADLLPVTETAEEEQPAGPPEGVPPDETPPDEPPDESRDVEAATAPTLDESRDPGGVSSPDDVEGLFARLRDPVDQPASSAETAAPAANGREETTAPVPTSAAIRTMTEDPFEVRDELLLPISNRALRNLKRQLTEDQNGALEEIRLDEKGWAPDPESLEAGVRPDLVVLAAESFAAGHAAAERFAGTRLTRPPTPPSELAREFAAALAADLVRAVADGRTHAHGGRELGTDVSRVFRAWRTDESERRLRNYSFTAFNLGLAESLAAGGVTDLRWVVSGRGCAVCRDLGGRTSFENAPPAHDGCGCTIVPL